MFKHVTLLTAGAVILTVAIAAGQQNPAQNPPGQQNPASPPTKSMPPASAAKATQGAPAAVATFLKKADQDGKAEVELGQLAQTKASSPQVKTYAQMLVTDHTQAGEQVAAMAKTKSVSLGTDMSAGEKSKAKLDKLSGAAFDHAYLTQMVSDHQQAIKDFEQASKSSDPDVKAFAEKTLPTL